MGKKRFFNPRIPNELVYEYSNVLSYIDEPMNPKKRLCFVSEDGNVWNFFENMT